MMSSVEELMKSDFLDDLEQISLLTPKLHFLFWLFKISTTPFHLETSLA